LIDQNVIDAMKAAGIPAEQILSVVEDALRRDAEIKAGRRELDRLRKRESRATEKQTRTTVASSLSVGQTRTNADTLDNADTVSPKEISPTPPKEITPSDIPPATPKGVSAPKPTPRSELGAVLDPVHTEAVIAHRQRIGKPMTAHAAHLLAGKFARCPNPDAAADAMVANGWQGFEPEWMDRSQPRAGPRGKPSPMDHFKNLAIEISDGKAGNDGSLGGNWDDAPGIPVRAIEHHGR
jgi:hypothetical protein